MRANRESERSRILEQQLWVAWELVRQRSPSAGIDEITVELFAGVVEQELRSLYKQLRSETYQASPAKGFYLSKKSGGKRLVRISTVRGRASREPKATYSATLFASGNLSEVGWDIESGHVCVSSRIFDAYGS